jgi:hypothetical protein
MKALKLILGIFIIFSLLGVIIGPIFLYRSYSYQNELVDFQKNGIKTSALLLDVYDNGNERYTSYEVDLAYNVKSADGTKKTLTAKQEWIYFKAMRSVEEGDEIDIYYKKDQPKEILLCINYAPEFIPLNRQSWWGWTITGFSIFFLLLTPIQKRLNK